MLTPVADPRHVPAMIPPRVVPEYELQALGYRVGDTVRPKCEPNGPRGVVVAIEYRPNNIIVAIIDNGQTLYANRICKYVPPVLTPMAQVKQLERQLKKCQKSEQSAHATYQARVAATQSAATALATARDSAVAAGVLPVEPENELHLLARLYTICMRRLEGASYATIGREQGLSSGAYIRQLYARSCRMLRYRDRCCLPKKRSHIPLWNDVFGNTTWQDDPKYAIWLDEEATYGR